MKRVLQFILPLCVLGGGFSGALWLLKNRKTVEPIVREQPVPLIEVVTVGLKDYRPVIRGQGRVMPRREIPITPQVSGKLLEVSDELTEGLIIEQGELLARIDDADYLLNRRSAEADILSAKASMTNALAQVASARAQASQAEARLAAEQAEAAAARSEWRLLGREGEPPALLLRAPQIREAETALAAAHAQEEAALAGIDSGKALLEAGEAARAKAELDLERCIVRSPFRGRVVQVPVDHGTVVSPASVIAVLQRVDFVDIRIPLAPRQLSLLGPVAEVVGGNVKLTYHGRVRNGKFHRMLGALDPGTYTHDAVVRLLEPYHAGKDNFEFGAYVSADLKGALLTDAALLPEQALRENGRVYLFVNGELIDREVQLIDRLDGQIVVLGLATGDQVCVTPMESFVRHMKVHLEVGGS